MLQHLRVRNMGVLVDASIDPSPGFTVITGETGAGKTLLVGGLRLVLGGKPDPSVVGPISDRRPSRWAVRWRREGIRSKSNRPDQREVPGPISTDRWFRLLH